MKANVSKDKCIGCGMCESIIDTVFQIGDEGYAEVIVDEIPEKELEDAQMAAESCPTEAIEIVDTVEEKTA